MTRNCFFLKVKHLDEEKELLQEMPNPSPCPIRAYPNIRDPQVDPGTDRNSPNYFKISCLNYFDKLESITSDKFHSDVLMNICSNVVQWSSGHLLTELESYLLQIFPNKGYGKAAKRANPSRVLSKRQKRRLEY